MKKKLVISGINLFKGGTLSIFWDCLDALIKYGVTRNYDVTAFVHKKELFEKYDKCINIIEIPKARKSYLYRIYYEYFYFYVYSKRENIDVWLSIHDMTPNVKATKRYVYCHNPTPFYKSDKKTWKYSKSVFFMSLFYKYVYAINIKKNNAVIVQQDWIRKKFKELYRIENIVVARPTNSKINYVDDKSNSSHQIFIYPALPRVFKNFEIICEAAKRLETENYFFELYLTIDGTENKYAYDLKKRYQHINSIKWKGFCKREKMDELYGLSTAMIFPSLLETWGLPISEYKVTSKPIILSDLPYAHETIGEYSKVIFINPTDLDALCTAMINVINGNNIYKQTSEINVEQPYARSWKELIDLLL